MHGISFVWKRCGKAKNYKTMLDNIPDGPVKSTDNKIAPPKRSDMKKSMEALIHHFKLYTEDIMFPLERLIRL